MTSFRGLGGLGGLGGGNGGDSLSLTVPLTPHVGCGPSPGVTAGAAAGASSSGPAEVRLAGVDTKEKMYEPKQRKKLVRVLTVVAYLFFVSLAAVMLSLYYVFLWNPSPKARHLTDEQLRAQEQATLRELQRIQEQRRVNEHLRMQEQLQREQLRMQEQLQREQQLQQREQQQQQREQQQQQREQQQQQSEVQREVQRLALRLQQQESQREAEREAWTSTLPPDYADFTENAEDDELYTVEPPPLLRHHGDRSDRGADALEDADNAIPQARRPQQQGELGPASRPRPAHAAPDSSATSRARASLVGTAGPRAFHGHSALRRINLLHGLWGSAKPSALGAQRVD